MISSDAGFTRHLRRGAGLGRVGLAGAASGQLVGGVVLLRPGEAMAEAMLRGWRARQAVRGLRAKTIGVRERLVRRLVVFTNEFPWQWSPGHVDEWTLALTAGHHLAPATIGGYQSELRLFSEYLTDARYGWAAACERESGPGVRGGRGRWPPTGTPRWSR
jgi:integrase/recombinase XerC